MKGLEPPRPETLDPKSNAATNYATCALFDKLWLNRQYMKSDSHRKVTTFLPILQTKKSHVAARLFHLKQK